MVSADKGVLEEIRKYYTTLYTSDGNIDRSYVEKLNFPRISETTKTFLDRDLEQKEVDIALDQLNNSKTPGTDGIPSDFLKVFWRSLKSFVYELMKEIIRDGQLHLTARYGILSLLEKTGRDTLWIKNWHPLTLLNTDNKLYGKILANRLNYAIPVIIHHTQTGFIKGKQAAENILKIMQLISHSDKMMEDNLIISFDFEKAFDSVEWNLIFASLVEFNFGTKFIDMIMTLYNEPLICAYNNGFWSEFWSPTRGCRQGCTFSPLIFAVTIETLGLAIRQNNDIQGIKIGNQTIKLGQFAVNNTP